MVCSICSNKNSKLKIKDYPGYIENSYFDIYYCDNCCTSFIDKKNVNLSIYNTIYEMLNNNPASVRAYDRYLNYSKKIKEYENPFLFLIYSENTYFPIYEFINRKKSLKILEIGCGYGYLTYALNKLGHHAKGIDISKEAINFAKDNFGDNYFSGDLLQDDYFKNSEFDLIIATELIEHLTEVHPFLKKCKDLLKPKGQIIITTPSKDWGSSVSKSYWFTDNPPVHTLWLSKKSLTTLGSLHNLETSFLSTLNRYYSKNFLLWYLSDKYLTSKIKPNFVIFSNPKKVNNNENLIARFIKLIMYSNPIKYISNIFMEKIVKLDPTICVLYSKN